jgi:hypothetical protein
VPVGRSNPSRSLRLPLLAPDLVEAIPAMLEELERPLAVQEFSAICRAGHCNALRTILTPTR